MSHFFAHLYAINALGFAVYAADQRIVSRNCL